MDRLFGRSAKAKEDPPAPMPARPPEAHKTIGPAVPKGMELRGVYDPKQRAILPGGIEQSRESTRQALDGIAGLAMAKANELQQKESTMPSLEDAAEDEKDEVMRLDAESDVWSRISGALARASSEQDPFQRLARTKNEISVLRNTNLGKGPEAEVIKLKAVEEIEKRLRM